MKGLLLTPFAVLKPLLPLSALTLLTATCRDAGRITQAYVSAGASHSCAVTTAGVVHCWGENRGRQFGDGTNMDSNVPVAVSGGLTFQSVSAGYEHTCGLTAAGASYCWGENEDGRLGDGTNTGSSVPVLVDLIFDP